MIKIIMLLFLSFNVVANDVVLENLNAGTTDWKISKAAEKKLEGYPSSPSVKIGGSIDFHVNSAFKNFSFQVFRLGWYNGLGGRAMTSTVVLPGVKQPKGSIVNNRTKLFKLNWSKSYSLDISDTWTSGFYVVKLTGDKGVGSYIPFVVTSDHPAMYLFQAAVNTWQAYNAYGSKSYYGDEVRAYQVSFQRPYLKNKGMGMLGDYEIPAMYFLEKNGYDVTYSSNIDIDKHPEQTLNYSAILSIGHDEYWTKNNYDAFENARNKGIGLAFIGANMAYWQSRYDDNYNILTCYKEKAKSLDPVILDKDKANDKLVTTNWRSKLVNRPENQLVGIMYTDYTKNKTGSSIVISNPNSWVFNNTGLKKGSKLPKLLGYEIDSKFNNGYSPKTLSVIANSVLNDPMETSGGSAHMATYTTDCLNNCIDPQATVFASGSMYFTRGINPFDNRRLKAAEIIMQNVLQRIIE